MFNSSLTVLSSQQIHAFKKEDLVYEARTEETTCITRRGWEQVGDTRDGGRWYLYGNEITVIEGIIAGEIVSHLFVQFN